MPYIKVIGVEHERKQYKKSTLPSSDSGTGNVSVPPRFSWLLSIAGWVCTGLGVAGIFLPLLPTVPLLLLAAACFARSSPRCHDWLMEHPQLGPLVSGYLDGGGIPLRAKVTAIIMLWLSVLLSLYLAAPPQWVRVLLLFVAGGVTLYLLRLPLRSSRNGT